MWEGLVQTPRGRLSTRNLLCVLATLLVALFANLLILTPDALAVDAEWQGSSIIYANDTYQGPKQATRNDGTELPAGSSYYVHTDGGRAWVIYFAPGADPPNESSATVRTYDSRGGKLSNPRGEKAISLEPQGETAPGTTSEGTSGECNVDGIGWMVCPISNQLAGAVDSIYGFIEDFFVVQPLTDGNNSLYRVWDVMRDIANILFIIGFLVIIYSYITGGVLTNYTLKAILPRIIIAAIMINVSYWICAVAVDITNITGVAFNDLFMTIRDSAIGTEENTEIKWTEVTAYILSGGGAVAGTLAFMSVAGGSVASLWFMIVAALIGAAFAVLVALVILAARQALITIFVIIAPLAIAAYILPNTEQWFDRWRKAFITVLIIFPIFGILFGGSQLASSLIMQNAPTLAVLILGLVVQVVPLVLTPFLIQFSGGLLGRIAGMTNNSSRGLADRSRNWARDRADYHKQRALGREAGAMNFMRRGGQGFDRRRRAREDRKKNFESMAQNRYHRSRPFEQIDQQRRGLEMEHAGIEAGHERHFRQAVAGGQSGTYFGQLRSTQIQAAVDRGLAKNAEDNVEASGARALSETVIASNALRNQVISTYEDKKRGEILQQDVDDRAKSRFERISTDITDPAFDATLRTTRLQAGQSSDSAKKAEAEWNSLIENIRTKGADAPTISSTADRAIAGSIKQLTEDIEIEGNIQGSAKRVQSQNLAADLKTNEALRVRAAGVDETGANRVLAAAKSTVSSAFLEDIKNIENTMPYDRSSDSKALKAEFISSDNIPMAERIAMVFAAAKNGSSGYETAVDMIRWFHDNGGGSGQRPSKETMEDFKELLGTNPKMKEGGRDVEMYLNAGDDITRTIDDFTHDVGVWDIHASRFVGMSKGRQLNIIRHLQRPGAGQTEANMLAAWKRDIMNTPTLRASLKREPKELLGIPLDE